MATRRANAELTATPLGYLSRVDIEKGLSPGRRPTRLGLLKKSAPKDPRQHLGSGRAVHLIAGSHVETDNHVR
ncbi:hypothetical protein VMCG_10517 [Cytospora schulzeri]|uniref:Uncharacterized protein n=1 Tax=Cytospora schulzeri TaxID=448051 RepID=A0A423VC30_9PEZI|nr:hypothetical protein VMCG_10517 [Valsa malicola]